MDPRTRNRSPATSRMDIEERVERLLDGPVSALGYELVGVEFTVVGGRRTVRVTIDRDGGIGTADCERVHDAVTDLLDVEDPVAGAWDLEISSPGIERLLKRPAHFERFVGHEVKLKTREPIEGRRAWQGRIEAVDDGCVVLGLPEGPRRIPFAAVDRANLKVDYARYFKKGERDAGSVP